jgi:arylsulfatase A-like enzyme
MILRLPRTWQDRPQGAEVDSVVCLQDILPTFVHAAGGQTPEDRDGQDLVALATGALAEPRRYLLCGQGFNQRVPENIQWAGVTDGRWKYAWYYGDGREQMFDLADDPHELHDLAQAPEHEAKKRELRAETIRQLQAHGGRYLKDGELYSRDEPIPTDDQLRSRGFPGFMADDHPSDALH